MSTQTITDANGVTTYFSPANDLEDVNDDDQYDQDGNYIGDVDEEEDEFLEVYHSCRFGLICGRHEHLKALHDYTYYMCWGGGPEGGYITNGETTYRVNRSWFNPWTVESVDGQVTVCLRDGLQQLRITK